MDHEGRDDRVLVPDGSGGDLHRKDDQGPVLDGPREDHDGLADAHETAQVVAALDKGPVPPGAVDESS